MAKQNSQPKNTSAVDTRSFIKGMIKDLHSSFQPKEAWSHARNAANNSVDGDVAVIGNEPANLECAKVPYTLIGAIHRYGDQWVLYSTDDTNSEIGLFDDSECKYTTLINDPCLNFKRLHLITGASKENFDCTWQVYWDDGNNPSRTLNIDNIPWKKIIISNPGADCIEYGDTLILNCEELRLAPLLDTPCIALSAGEGGGQMRNGSYQAYIAYAVNEIKVTDYIGISNIQSLSSHEGSSGSLQIEISNLDQDFDYFELVILSNNQQAVSAKRVGLYSTQQSTIGLDYLDNALTSISLKQIPFISPAFEKSDAMYVVNDYLIRQGPTEQFDFNYQPLANQIKTKWVVAEYPSNYYYNAGNKVGFMRDEQYSFFIRWIYNTGERSSSYHIPGRAPRVAGINQFGQTVDETAINIGTNSISSTEKNFQVFNTATITTTGLTIPTDDNGLIIAKGDLGYWESSEKYPTSRPDIWDKLCGKPIRHHKMPTEELGPDLHLSTQDGETIRVLGVEFENISPPIDNAGNVITNIVGYELLRGSRLGNMSILAKGIFRNMRMYEIPDGATGSTGKKKGLYPNYPYNDLRDDIFFHDGVNAGRSKKTDGCDTWFDSMSTYKPLKEFKKDFFTFHSPELTFKRPALDAYETRIYGDVVGKSIGNFIPSENHPKAKLLRNSSAVIAAIVGVGYAIKQVQGTKARDRKEKTRLDIQAMYSPFADVTYTSAYLGLITAATTALVAAATANTTKKVAKNLPGAAMANLNSGDSAFTLADNLAFAANVAPGTIPFLNVANERHTTTYDSASSTLPPILKTAMGIPLAVMNASIGADEIIELLYNVGSYYDFAYKHNSHGFYNKFINRPSGNLFRTKTKNASLLRSAFHEFEGYKVNNLHRPSTTIVRTDSVLADPVVTDTSRYAVGGDSRGTNGTFTDPDDFKNPGKEREATISCIYGALKYQFKNQYGQLDGIKQIQMRGCIELVDIQIPQQKFKAAPIFDGDTYIGRYTEKTIMPIFTAFLNGEPDGYAYDYMSRINIPYPRFWMDTVKFDTTQLSQEVISLSLASTSNPLPNDLFYLDRGQNSCITNFKSLINRKADPNRTFFMTTAYMYTHINGIQDFFVESKYNLAHREWEDEPGKYHFDETNYTDVDTLFHANTIKKDNFYLMDPSVSKNTLPTQLNPAGRIQPREYDPYVAENCYQHYPKRLIYSLQSRLESKKDFWRVFLTNNYQDFKNKPTVIKPINKTGALIFFPYKSPQMFQGVDTLKTDLGVKFTLGDGGLFNNQPLQNIVNSDLSNEWGSLESARSAINTPHGIFYISQAQGKVFQYSGQLDNIANSGMKWWFNKYLPSTLIRQFPDLELSKLSDNPVIGIGCQTVYDPNDNIVYFMKKDFKLKDDFVTGSRIFNDKIIILNPATGLDLAVTIGDPIYFDDTSWTVSYDPKAKAWISFHDWHPELSLPSINHFLTTKTVNVAEGSCPDGYNYNPDLELCEKIDRQTSLAVVDKTEVPATISNNGSECKEDVVFAIDTSTFTGGYGPGTRGSAEMEFIKLAIDEPILQSRMASGEVQIGIISYSDATAPIVSMNPNGFSMSSTLTGAQVVTWLQANWLSAGSDVLQAVSTSETVLNDKVGSDLGDRTTTLGFRQNIILVTATIPENNINACAYQSSTLGGSAAGPANQFLSVIYASGLVIYPFSVAPPGIISFACTRAYTASIYATRFNLIANVTYFLPPNQPNCSSGGGGGEDPVCNCPPGYTKVYKDSSGNYTQPTGICDVSNPPICRKIECNCPPTPFTGGTTTVTGICDDIYLSGSPAYINPTPQICSYFLSTTTEISSSNTGIWRHNFRCDLFSNYYGKDYPWEVELIENTGQQVTTLRSVEYQLESYVYKGDLYNGCADDRWHDLDFNFDESIIYNSEQVSGLLKLELSPKEDPYGILQYPLIGLNDIRILYSKEEQKYRFNQFWDATDDRGEFTGVQRSAFITQLNGYIKDLNALNLNYYKDKTQHKKFRHYYNKVLLRRNKSKDRKMLLKLANTKLNNSFR